jgi:hypothetical protein
MQDPRPLHEVKSSIKEATSLQITARKHMEVVSRYKATICTLGEMSASSKAMFPMIFIYLCDIYPKKLIFIK